MPQPINSIVRPTSGNTPVTEPILPTRHQGHLLSQQEADLGTQRRVQPDDANPARIDPDGTIGRVLAAAVINRRFCRLLLTNPAVALAVGYRGESFPLSAAEKALFLRIHATTLQEFAHLLLLEIEKANVLLDE